MNTILAGFIGIQEIIVIILLFSAPVALIGLAVVALLKYIKTPSTSSKAISDEPENQISKFQDESFKTEDIKNYYPVKEGSKISLIRFDDIVDFSADNNYVFLTDVNGKDYVVESNLTELETKLPKEFLRVHKSAIINSKLIGEIKKLANGRYDLVMKCDKNRIISCSKNYNENIKSIIDF